MDRTGVGKGSWQNRSVTLGKGLALRIGSVGLELEASGSNLDWLLLFRAGLDLGGIIHYSPSYARKGSLAGN